MNILPQKAIGNIIQTAKIKHQKCTKRIFQDELIMLSMQNASFCASNPKAIRVIDVSNLSIE